MQIAAAPKAAAPKPIEQPKELPKKPIIKKLVSKTLSTKPAPLVEQPPEEKPQINSAQNTATSAQADANDVSVPAVAEAVADKAARCQTPEIPITQDAANAGITSGKVILEVQINADGKVTTAKLLKGTGFHIDSNVIEFAKKMKCQPALKDGKTVAVIKRLQWVVQR
ncbi:MAG: TonB family protein [Bdellovibrionota bacterium]